MDSRIKAFLSTIARTTKGNWVDQAGLADGTPFTADWLLKLALDGRMYIANIGTGTAPVTGGGAYVNTAPDVDMSVPAGVLVIPIFAKVVFETAGTSLLNEVVGVVGRGGVIAPTSATAVTPACTRLDAPNGPSRATIVSDGTGATYMTDNIDEFWRDGAPMSITKTSASATVSSIDPPIAPWSALATGHWPIMYSPNQITRLNLFFASQAPTYFAQLVYVEPDPAILLG